MEKKVELKVITKIHENVGLKKSASCLRLFNINVAYFSNVIACKHAVLNERARDTIAFKYVEVINKR